MTDVNELKFKDGRNIGVNYMPDADSPVLTAASFNDALLSSGFETVEYIGAFGTDDNWLDGWTNSILIIQTTNTPLNIHT